jgi:hypothetical protein
LASLLRIRIRRNSSEQRCGIPELTSWGDAGTLDSIEDGVELQSTEFCDVCFTAAIGRTANDKGHSGPLCRPAVLPCKYMLPRARVWDMNNPSRSGRTALAGPEVSTAI